MEKFYTIGETAKLANVTTETLRHYDRIGLISPCKTDEWTGYRYYSERELLFLNIVRALRRMDFSLQEIKEILESGDFERIIAFFRRAEQNADEKIAELLDIKERIARARRYYEGKSAEKPRQGLYTEELLQRVILLSDSLTQPMTANLWNYHRHFYAQVGADKKDSFAFVDTAGVYEADGQRNMFAICERYEPTDGLRVLPAGTYLCADCTEDTRESAKAELLQAAKERGLSPAFVLHVVVLSGITRWFYRLQVPIGRNDPTKERL